MSSEMDMVVSNKERKEGTGVGGEGAPRLAAPSGGFAGGYAETRGAGVGGEGAPLERPLRGGFAGGYAETRCGAVVTRGRVIVPVVFGLALALAMAACAAPVEIVVPEKANAVERFASEELKYHLDRAIDGGATIVREGVGGEGAPRLAAPSGGFAGGYAETKNTETRGTGVRFFIGATKAAAKAGLPGKAFAEEEHLVQPAGNDIFLLGEDTNVPYEKVDDTGASKRTGTLYAVYDYLETECGVRWIFPGELGEVIPKLKAPPIPSASRRKTEPLISRKWSGTRMGGDKARGFASQEQRKRYFAAQRRYLCRHHVGHRRYIASGHSFNDWWKKYGKEHPEYFNLLPYGKREPLYGNAWGATMCVSEPGVWSRKVDEWKRRLKGCLSSAGTPNEWLPWINCCENDYAGLCTCPRCRSWDAPDERFAKNPYWNGSMDKAKLDALRKVDGNYGLDRVCGDERWVIPREDPATRTPASLSDRYLKFYNNVVALARKDVPTAKVIGYAYDNYVEAPKETKVADGVVIEFVSRSYFPYDKTESDWFRRHWSGWRAAGAKELVHRPNFTLAGGNYPVDSGRLIVDDFAFAATNGMIACMFDALRGSWACHLMESYALMRALRDPTRGYEKAREDVLSGFGSAAPAFNRYLDEIERFTEKWNIGNFREAACRNITGGRTPGGSFPNSPAILGDFYDDGFFPKMQSILDEAIIEAKGDAKVIARIGFVKKGLRDAELTRLCRIAQKKMEANVGDKSAKAEFARAFRALVAYRATVEGDFICNFQHETEAEVRIGWPHGKKLKEYEVW